MDKMLLWSSAWSEDEYWRNLEEQQIRVDSDMTIAEIDKKQFNCYMVAHNDGLSYQDWLDWFKGEEV